MIAGMQVWCLSLCLTNLCLVPHTCTCNSRQSHISLETCRLRVILFITCPPSAPCMSGTGITLVQPRMGRLSDLPWSSIHMAGSRCVLWEADAMLCHSVLCCAVLCCAALRCAVLCCAVLCCAALCWLITARQWSSH